MIHKGIKFAYMLIVAVAAVMSFIVVRNFDEVALSGPSYVVLISHSDGTTNAAQVTQMVTSFAHERATNIGRLTTDSRDPDTHRHVYLAIGDPTDTSVRWLAEGYPNFSRNAQTDMHPYADLKNIGPIGYYFVYGPQEVARDFLARFESLGFGGRIDPLFSMGHALSYFGQGALLWCVLIIVLVVMVTITSGVVLNAKAYGVQRLQGCSWTAIFLRDLVQIVRFFLGALAVVFAVTLTALYAYNRLHQLDTYLLVAGGFLGSYTVIALVAHLAGLFLLSQTAILGSIKGELSAGWAMVFAYSSRLAAVVVTLFIGVSFASDAVTLRDSQSDMAAWVGVDRAYFAGFGSYGFEEAPRIEPKIGRWVREADSRGEIILSRYYMGDYKILNTGTRQPRLGFLAVNETYLARNTVLDTTGGRVAATVGDRSAVRILIPQDQLGKAAQITDGVKDRLRGSSTRAVGQPVFQVEPIRSSQKVFSYGSWLNDHDLILTAPVIVVVIGSSGVISDGDYMAFASTGDVIIEDPDVAAASLREIGVSEYIQGFYSKSQEAAERHRDVVRSFTMQVFNLMAAIVVLLVTGLSVSIIYSRKNAQMLFVRFISGWRFLSTYRSILMIEVGLAITLVSFTWWRVSAEISARTQPMARPLQRNELLFLRLEPAVAAGVAFLGLVLVVVALAYIYSRIVREHSASLA